jgi:lipid A ethanolaminephosphotransferase
MFSPMTREQYKPDIAHSEDSLMDVLHHAKINLLWRENDTGCYGVCDRIPHVEMKAKQYSGKYCQHGACYDGILLEGLRDYINKRKKDTVIVLHLIGSHGPSYYQRYPSKFSTFTPSCNQANIQDCEHSHLINVYDNTLVYTDYVLDRVIQMLKAQHSAHTAMIYLSDHGESLGEKGFYLHAAPYIMAPKEQTTVPFIVWLSKSMTQHKKLNVKCLKQESQRGGYSQDYLFSSVLGLMDVKTKVYKPALDVFSKCET